MFAVVVVRAPKTTVPLPGNVRRQSTPMVEDALAVVGQNALGDHAGDVVDHRLKPCLALSRPRGWRLSLHRCLRTVPLGGSRIVLPLSELIEFR